MNKITVIHHSADFDGIFCREIARKFLPPETEFVGWDYRDPKIPFPKEGTVYGKTDGAFAYYGVLNRPADITEQLHLPRVFYLGKARKEKM